MNVTVQQLNAGTLRDTYQQKRGLVDMPDSGLYRHRVRVQLWFDLVWYCYHRASGLSASAFTETEAIAMIAAQYAERKSCDLSDIAVEVL